MSTTGAISRKAKLQARYLAAPVLAVVLGAALAQTASAQSLAFIEQVGDYNRTVIDQTAASGVAAASVALNGADNLAEATQSGADNRAVLSARGNRNGRGDAPGGAGRTIAFTSKAITQITVSNGNNNGNNGQGDPCGDGKGQGVGNPCNGNSGNTGGQGNSGGGNTPPALTTTLTPLAGLESGVIRQDGQRNRAGVLIAGDSNDFHVSQLGNDNKAAQAISGSFNQAAIVQGTPAGAKGNGNSAVVAQRGSTNSSYVHQAGNNNLAVGVQAGGLGATADLAGAAVVNAGPLAALAGSSSYAASAEAVIAGYSARGNGSGNSITLQQTGDDNTAMLAQLGNDNSIALRQPGFAYAAVTQLGNGHSIGIDQQAGVGGVVSSITVTQF